MNWTSVRLYAGLGFQMNIVLTIQSFHKPKEIQLDFNSLEISARTFMLPEVGEMIVVLNPIEWDFNSGCTK
jgi:hypothetical protein